MEQSSFALLVLRIMISIIGIVGNTFLIISVLHLSQVKTFEVFLLGLAVANLEEIVIVDIYDATVLQNTNNTSFFSCSTLHFLTTCGEVSSILFTVLISVYRYQKLHNAAMRIISPIFMDSKTSAICLSLGCILVAVILGMPTYIMKQDTPPMENSTMRDCPSNFFQCSVPYCSSFSYVYKYVFVVFCHILPLVIVTGTSALIIHILIVQQKVIDALHDSDPPAIAAYHHNHHHHEHDVFHRSTIGILAAMGLFQVDCILYLILHLILSPLTFPAWAEMNFFTATFYTGIIPYIYGTGHNFFSLKHFMKR